MLHSLDNWAKIDLFDKPTMLPLKGISRINYVILCGLIYLKIMSSHSQRQRGPKFIPFKLTEGRQQKFIINFK